MTSRFLKILLTMLVFPCGLYAQQRSIAIVINHRNYIGNLTSDNFILTHKKDTILNLPQNDYVSFEFGDFNNDGYKDIFLQWGGNIPERFDLYEFLPLTNTFHKIKYFSDLPSAKHIKGTKYYYSYFPSGCADEAWGSHLFYVDNKWNAITIGKIKKDGCGTNDSVVIYKVVGQKKIALKTLSINIVDNYKRKKWRFIEHYWTKNYQKFL